MTATPRSKGRRLGSAGLRMGASLAALAFLTMGGTARGAEASEQQTDRSILPIPDAKFTGRMGATVAQSTPAPVKRIRAPAGAPNVILILTDDVGFGATGAFGGLIPTPTFDRLAQEGVRYNQFHTAAVCSATRAALLTGRNHHAVANGTLVDQATSYPGYNGIIPKSAVGVAEILKLNGYSTAMFGKHHLAMPPDRSVAGPFDQWPQGLGFEYFYGFNGGETNQWTPTLHEGTRPVEIDYKNTPHLDTLLADQAIRWLRDMRATASDRPFFMYYAPGATHGPSHAPKAWIDRFHGKFDMGWDKAREQILANQKRLGIVPRDTRLAARPPGVPAWDSLSADQKKVAARMMEVYAAHMAFADHNIGRVIDELRRQGRADNTLIIFIQGDNGADLMGGPMGSTIELSSANGVTEDIPYLMSMLDKMGGPDTYPIYPSGWAFAMNTPFPWGKQVASHLGGLRDGMVMSWPNHMKDRGVVRQQFGHVIDVLPTILEAAKLPAPASVNGVPQQRVDGQSLLSTLDDPGRQAPRTQYFEMFGNRSIYKDGWMASTTPMRPPWVLLDPAALKRNAETDYRWELYNLEKDFSQSQDLAARNPRKLAELKAEWTKQAWDNNVFPLDDSLLERVSFSVPGKPQTFRYLQGDIRIPVGTAPRTQRRSFSISTLLTTPPQGASGVLATIGGRFGGWTFFVDRNRLNFTYVLSNQPSHIATVTSEAELTPGEHRVRMDFDLTSQEVGGPAQVKLWVDGAVVGTGVVPKTTQLLLARDETFDVGQDTGTPGNEAYRDRMPFRYSATFGELIVDVR